MLTRKSSKLKNSFNQAFLAERSGGTVIDIIAVIIIIGLVMAGVMWVIKQAGDAGQEYSKGMVSATNKATSIVCTSNMGQIYQILQMHSITENELPALFEDLVNEVGTAGVFQCPEPNSPVYEYIPGQTLSSPPDDILLYEPLPVHNGRCNVLRVSGKVEMITPEELQAALEQTLAHLSR